MQPSERLVKAVEQFEGFRSVAYRDLAGVLTVGYGETQHITPGQVVTQQEAELMLRADLTQVASEVQQIVTVALTQGQFDALVDFAYNLGIGSLERSTLLQRLNAGDYSGACEQLGRWTLAGGQPVPGLVRRRQAEQAWWNESTPPAA